MVEWWSVVVGWESVVVGGGGRDERHRGEAALVGALVVDGVGGCGNERQSVAMELVGGVGGVT